MASALSSGDRDDVELVVGAGHVKQLFVVAQALPTVAAILGQAR